MAEEYGVALKDLVGSVADRDAEFEELSVPSENLAFREDVLACNGREFRMDQHSRDNLFEGVNAPASYWQKHSAGFQALALSEHAGRGDFTDRPMLVIRKGALVTLVRNRLLRLPNAAVLGAVLEALGREGESLSVAKLEHESERLEVELVSPSKTVDVRVGDIVMGGIHIIHGWHSDQPTLIQSFVYRLTCRNGMTRRECGSGNGLARTRKLPVDYPNARELQLDQIRRLTVQHWNGLQRQLEVLRATSERGANVQEVLTRWLQRARMSPRLMMPRLLSAWEREGAENTYYGAVNALTRVATHDGSLGWRQRRMLAALGGLLAFSDVHICPRCFSVLSGSATGDMVTTG